MDRAAITQYITDTFTGVDVVVASQDAGSPEIAWGDTFFSYDPDGTLPSERRFPFATIVTKDYSDFDAASNLNREGVFRLNIGVGRETYHALFGAELPRATANDDGECSDDFTVLDQLLPHPVYGRQYWVCILNPSAATFQNVVQPLLAEAYDRTARTYTKRTTRD